MKLRCIFCLFLIATACHNKEDAKETNQTPVVATLEQKKASEAEKKPKISKILRESIYFAASLEREALKLLIKNNQIQRNTLFSVLSYAIETNSGTRKSTPLGIDCGKYDVQFEKNFIVVNKACHKPLAESVRIVTISEDNDYAVEFSIAQWGSVLGNLAVLTGNDIKCRLHIVEQKLNGLNCENWIFQQSEDQLSSTVIKASEFAFQRNATKQFVIKGGYYKELVQNKKIDIVIPLEGKIKIIEKEIKVIDEFAAQKDGYIEGINHEKKERIEIKPVEEKSNEEKNGQSENQTGQEGQQSNQIEVQPIGEEGSVSPTSAPASNQERGSRGR